MLGCSLATFDIESLVNVMLVLWCDQGVCAHGLMCDVMQLVCTILCVTWGTRYWCGCMRTVK